MGVDVSTVRYFRIECDGSGPTGNGCARSAGGYYPSAKTGRKIAQTHGWLSIPGNSAARPNHIERLDYCPDCRTI